MVCNRPFEPPTRFPSCLLPWFQNARVLVQTIHCENEFDQEKICLICIWMDMWVKLIFTLKGCLCTGLVFKQRQMELGNGLIAKKQNSGVVYEHMNHNNSNTRFTLWYYWQFIFSCDRLFIASQFLIWETSCITVVGTPAVGQWTIDISQAPHEVHGLPGSFFLYSGWGMGLDEFVVSKSNFLFI